MPNCPEGVRAPELSPDCYESATTPHDLFRKLHEWNVDALVIPHGNTWDSTRPRDHVGQAAEARPARSRPADDHRGGVGTRKLGGYATEGDPLRRGRAPSAPSHGRTIAELLARGSARRGAAARRAAMPRSARRARRTLDCGTPTWGSLVTSCSRRRRHRLLDAGSVATAHPGVQLARRIGTVRPRHLQPDDPEHPARSALAYRLERQPPRPARDRLQGVRPARTSDRAGPATRSGASVSMDGRKASTWAYDLNIQRTRRRQQRIPAWAVALEAERQASFFLTGGLAAVHAEGRSRDEVWKALRRREVYGTSGDRILLWFNLLNGSESTPLAMGGATRMSDVPRFEVRAVGAFKQKPGCPDYSVRALAPDRLEKLCRGECYNPSDERKLITRIEVVRIRPQRTPGEPVRNLIDDPWRRLPRPPSQSGCSVQFEDDSSPPQRDTLYYVRARSRSQAVNGGQLRCDRDEKGSACASTRVTATTDAGLGRLPRPDRRAGLVVAHLHRSCRRRLRRGRGAASRSARCWGSPSPWARSFPARTIPPCRRTPSRSSTAARSGRPTWNAPWPPSPPIDATRSVLRSAASCSIDSSRKSCSCNGRASSASIAATGVCARAW